MPDAPTGHSASQRRVLQLVQRHGWNVTAFQTFGAEFTYFFHGDGCVAYVDTGSAWVAAGAPIAATDELAAIGGAFVRAAREAPRRCCFVATEDRFRHATAADLRAVAIGEQPVWDPQTWPDTLRRHSRLREQLRRARAKGVRVRRIDPAELDAGPLADATAELARRWLATRAMPPMRFLVGLGPFTFPELRRCFVAERDGRVVGVAHVIPVPGRRGWFLEHLVRDPQAPNGTVEALVDAVMRRATEEGCTWLTLGTAPLAGAVPRPLRFARSRLRFLYDFEGLQRFKAKLRPAAWCPIYLSYPRSQGVIVTFLDVLAAFVPGGLLRFGARCLARGPSVVLVGLGVLLVPWIALMAGASAEQWFGGRPGVKWAWVGFDVLLLVGLVVLRRRRSPGLATGLALAVTVDALVTPVEAALWNLPQLRGWLDGLVIALACIGPALAAIVLWGTRARLVRMAREPALLR
ncbi:phosphatidylglycerol lysyltransferase [Nannocystis exedens]|uniref:Phosphatidylglycerol lysyltransferase n=1 Tax=Nannocystis exedens TaxID=54 RepID=A0A1I2BXL1_9BACT|nr:DUF2156 domain-containing protein [Nannocystis exedens]PCC71193.1 Phosphatidylglycerol lysyltransferase [Nannocystis exedens]SFE60851.1 phosphatidylglycerol lysyltransferase [Nannocystis exedens]